MRSGTCGAPQQTLTPEAASVLKHSLSLAARRGHSHVTPLHVASTLLSSKQSSSSSSTITLLRRACLKSHPPNPLHSRALELCFNVALNRLPTSPPLLHSPSLSNALIAALKRAQAHQRRGSSCSSSSSSSLDHHHHPHHPLLTIKVELHHLIISILDDPSVSRVMREAGFSSTCVKNNIQHYANTILISPPSSPIINSHFFSPQTPTPLFFSSPPPSNSISTAHNAASKFVFDVFLGIISKNNNNNNSHKTTGNNNNNNSNNNNNNNNNSNNVVVLGDSLGVAEGVVFEVMRKLKMGAEVPHELKGVKFLEFPLFMGMSSSYSSELKRKLGECCSNNNNGNGGVVVYVGDLKWIVERNNNNHNNSKEGEGEEEGFIDGLVGEIERLLVEGFNGGGDNGNNNNKIKIWVVAVATYQTYMRCQMRQPPLETQWALHALALPSSGLGLSLHPSSVYDSRLSFFSQAMETKPFLAKEEHDQKLTCCGECTSNFENEVHHLKSCNSKQVPSWLQSHSKDEIAELKRKWNKLCSSLHREGCVQSLMGKSFSYSSSYPWWPKFHESNSISSTDHQTPKPLQSSNIFVPRFRRQQSCTTIEFDFGNAATKHNQDREPSLNSLKHMVGKELKITLALGNPLFCESSAESMEMESERKSQRGEILKALQENVPWQSESIPYIAEAVVSAKKNERSIQWILIEGNDFIGKRKMSVAIAESIFGSVDYLLNLNAKSEEMGISRSEMLEKALKSNRELVVLVEDVDLADSQFMKLLEDGFQSGKLGEVKEESIEKVIFILTKDDDDSSDKKKNRASSSSSSSSSSSVIEMTLKIESREKPNSDHKRKAEWEIENKSKNQRTKANLLDLNLKANEEEEEEEEEEEDDDDDEETEQKLPNGQISPISSDLTLETTIRNGFLESISNRFILNKKARQESEMKRELRGKMGEAYKENCKKWENSRFRVEEGVLEGIIDGFGSFSNKMFEKWVKEIFQTSLEGGRYGGGKGEGGIDISLCLDHKHILEEEEDEEDDGYMGSCLPKKIKLSSMNSKWFFL